MSFGKMATLLFGLAALIAMVSFAVLPAAPTPVASGGADGHIETTHAEVQGPAEDANRGPAMGEPGAALPDAPSAAPGDPGASSPADEPVSIEAPAADQDHVRQQPGGAPGQPAAPRAPQVQAAPQVSFEPGQPMIDTNPSR